MTDTTYIVYANYHRKQKRHRGWWGYNVRVPGTPRKLFSVLVLGKSKARAAAFRYRIEQVRLLGFKSVRALAKSRDQTAIGNSGVKGVQLRHSHSHTTSKGKVRRYVMLNWCAVGRVNGKRVQRYFSIKKYGNDRALAFAIAARKAMA